MVNPWLIVVFSLIGLVTLVVMTYIMVVYSHPDDKNKAWVPKVVVVLAFSLAAFSVILLPFDVANRVDPLILGVYSSSKRHSCVLSTLPTHAHAQHFSRLIFLAIVVFCILSM